MGTRSDVTQIARQLGAREILPAPVEMTALAGAIPLKIADARTCIEIVRNVPGVTDKEAEDRSVEREFSGQKIRVLDPISLLYCKAELAQKVSQVGRRDVDHLKMLVYCVRAFLREALRQTEEDAALQKGWLGAAEKVLSLTESAKGAKLSRRFDVSWREIFPEKEIARNQLPKLKSFRERRLPEWKRKMEMMN